jgi:fumarate reductase iron-sulfur subunit
VLRRMRRGEVESRLPRPRALNRAWTLVNDVRDGGQASALAAVAGDAGCHSCHTMMSCTELCPRSSRPRARSRASSARPGDRARGGGE